MASTGRKILWSVLVSGALVGAAEWGVRHWAPAVSQGVISPLAFQRQSGPISTPGEVTGSRLYGGPSIVTSDAPAGWRIFFFGGSATQGYHVSRWSSFAGWYERLLRELVPDQPVEVINLGAGGEGSRQVVDRVRGASKDGAATLFVVYSGNNEYYELRALKSAVPGFDARVELARRQASRFHLYRRMRDMLRPTQDVQPSGALAPVDRIAAEIDADERALGVVFYREHLEAIVDAAQEASIPLLLSTVADHRMSYAHHGDPPARSAGVEAGLKSLDAAGKSGDPVKVGQVLESLDGQLKTQGDYHEVGRLLLRDQMPEKAKAYFVEAEYLDPRPRRSNRAMREEVRRVGGETNTSVCDAARRLDARTRVDMAGDEYFFDPCHPTPAGHRALGEILLRCTVESGLLPLPGNREQQLAALERVFAVPIDQGDPLRLDHFIERRAQLHTNRGMTDEEVGAAVWAFDDSTPQGAARAGHHAYLFHRYDAALLWYDLALKRGGERGPLQVSRGLVHQNLHDIQAARAALDEARLLLPDDPVVAQHRLVLGDAR